MATEMNQYGTPPQPIKPWYPPTSNENCMIRHVLTTETSTLPLESTPITTPYIAPSATPSEPKHNHYFKDVSHLDTIDVYRVLDLFGVTDPCLGHALKKLLVAGGRGHKDISRDVQDVIDSCVRWQEMQKENNVI